LRYSCASAPCPHIKWITLPKILDSLLYMKEKVAVEAAIPEGGWRPIGRMIYLKN
jgi:quinolinate synthase